MATLSREIVSEVLSKLGLKELNSGVSTGPDGWSPTEGREIIESISPIDGKPIAKVALANKDDYERVITEAQKAFEYWREVPAPKRGQVIREIGNRLRAYKDILGKLVTIEVGKIYQEGTGEVQEMIDISDFALGLSRQLYGLTIQSEREHHRLYEQWLPLGPIGVITSFNFPVAVYSWNAFIAAVCGDTMVWKPSSSAPLSAIAVQKIIEEVLKEFDLPNGIFNLVIGKGSTVGEWMINDKRLPLISFTGSIPMGKRVAEKVAKRLGKTILELGGNNAAIVMEDANFVIAKKAILFGAVGTAGQRCTTTRRLLLHEKIYDKFLSELVELYKQVKVGNPLEEGVLCGPLIDKNAVQVYKNAIEEIKKQGGKILVGGRVIEEENGFYVEPTIVEANENMEIVKRETFAPILYVIKIRDIDEAIRIHNSVPQGLSSAIFTNNIKYEEKFLSAAGSDCGIANVNTSTSGAEIGGAFGGEKETGGGRESGSDAWKGYMRRQTVTINWGDDLPLAQGIKFGLDFGENKKEEK